MALILVLHNTATLGRPLEADDVCDYNCEALVGDGTRERSHTIAAAKVIGHKRSDGWKELVRKFMEQAVEQ